MCTCVPQILLLERSWNQIFILFASHLGLPSETLTLSSFPDINHGDSPDKLNNLISDLRTYRNLLQALHLMAVDSTEFTLLKMIAFFTPGKIWSRLILYYGVFTCCLAIYTQIHRIYVYVQYIYRPLSLIKFVNIQKEPIHITTCSINYMATFDCSRCRWQP